MNLRRFHFYHTATGALHGKYVTTNQAHGTEAEDFARANAPADHAVVEGWYSSATHAFDLQQGKIVDKPLQLGAQGVA